MAQRKLGRTADQRKALLRNQVTNLIWYGRIETTEARAKEVRRAAERLITLAVNECDNTVEVTKETHNDKGQLVTLNVVNDAPSKLHARRLMMSYLYELKDVQRKDEDKADWKEPHQGRQVSRGGEALPRIWPQVQKAQRGKEVRRWLHPHLQARTPSRRRCRDVRDRDHLIHGLCTGPA